MAKKINKDKLKAKRKRKELKNRIASEKDLKMQRKAIKKYNLDEVSELEKEAKFNELRKKEKDRLRRKREAKKR